MNLAGSGLNLFQPCFSENVLLIFIVCFIFPGKRGVFVIGTGYSHATDLQF